MACPTHYKKMFSKMTETDLQETIILQNKEINDLKTVLLNLKYSAQELGKKANEKCKEHNVI